MYFLAVFGLPIRLALGREVVQELHKPVGGNRVEGPAVVGGQQVSTPDPAVNAAGMRSKSAMGKVRLM